MGIECLPFERHRDYPFGHCVALPASLEVNSLLCCDQRSGTLLFAPWRSYDGRGACFRLDA